MHYGLLLDQSRKAKQAKSLFEYIRTKTRSEKLEDTVIFERPVSLGFRLSLSDRHRVVSLRLQDEHLSPYFKTDMNLFHLIMIDESIDISVFKSQEGILFVFTGLPSSPQPFGSHGHDTR
nr:hypothetical protein [Bacilli bacterium]